jgi:hypothetical protein
VPGQPGISQDTAANPAGAMIGSAQALLERLQKRLD